MQATQDLLLYVHTLFFCANFGISWFLIQKFQNRTLLIISDERKWIFTVITLFCGLMAFVIDLIYDPSELGGLAWIQGVALLIMSLMNTGLLWLITAPLDASYKPLKGYLHLRPSFITVFYHDVGLYEKSSRRLRMLWTKFLKEKPQTYYLWYVYAVPVQNQWDLRILPVDYPEEQWSQKNALGYFVGVLALKHPKQLRPWYEIFKARTNRDIPKLSEIPFQTFDKQAIVNPTAAERRNVANRLVKNIDNAMPGATCLTPIL